MRDQTMEPTELNNRNPPVLRPLPRYMLEREWVGRESPFLNTIEACRPALLLSMLIHFPLKQHDHPLHTARLKTYRRANRRKHVHCYSLR